MLWKVNAHLIFFLTVNNFSEKFNFFVNVNFRNLQKPQFLTLTMKSMSPHVHI